MVMIDGLKGVSLDILRKTWIHKQLLIEPNNFLTLKHVYQMTERKTYICRIIKNERYDEDYVWN